MSSAIKDVERFNQRQLETAKKRNARELKTIENAHKDTISDVKKIHDMEIIDIQDEHHRFINKEAEKKEKVLSEMKTQLHQTSALTDKQLKALKDNSQKETIETQQKLSVDRERINAEHELHLAELNDRMNQQAKKVNVEGKNRIEDTKSKMQEEYLNTEEYHQNKINSKSAEFTTRFNHDEKNYRQLKDNQDSTFKKERLSTNLRQQNQLNQMTQTHTQHIEKSDNEYRKGLKEKDLFFEKKYTKQLEHHNNEFKTLKEKNDKVLESLKVGLATEITKTANRNDDPFFKFETLQPRLKQFEDRVEIEVEVPEHSKQDIQLSINGKEAIVSFNRRYSDANKIDGTINKISKVETFTTRLSTDHFLDPKSVKGTFENGVMSYVIKKS